MEGPPSPSAWVRGQQLGQERGSPQPGLAPDKVIPFVKSQIVAPTLPLQGVPVPRGTQSLLPSAAGVSAQVAAAAARLSVASAALQSAAAERAGLHQGRPRAPPGSLGLTGNVLQGSLWPRGAHDGGLMGCLPALYGGIADEPALLRRTNSIAPVLGGLVEAGLTNGLQLGSPTVLLPSLGPPPAVPAVGSSLLRSPVSVGGSTFGARFSLGSVQGIAATAVPPAPTSLAAKFPCTTTASPAAAEAAPSAAAGSSPSTVGESLALDAKSQSAAVVAPVSPPQETDLGRVEQLLRCLSRGLVPAADAAEQRVEASLGVPSSFPIESALALREPNAPETVLGVAGAHHNAAQQQLVAAAAVAATVRGPGGPFSSAEQAAVAVSDVKSVLAQPRDSPYVPASTQMPACGSVNQPCAKRHTAFIPLQQHQFLNHSRPQQQRSTLQRYDEQQRQQPQQWLQQHPDPEQQCPQQQQLQQQLRQQQQQQLHLLQTQIQFLQQQQQQQHLQHIQQQQRQLQLLKAAQRQQRLQRQQLQQQLQQQRAQQQLQQQYLQRQFQQLQAHQRQERAMTKRQCHQQDRSGAQQEEQQPLMQHRRQVACLDPQETPRVLKRAAGTPADAVEVAAASGIPIPAIEEPATIAPVAAGHVTTAGAATYEAVATPAAPACALRERNFCTARASTAGTASPATRDVSVAHITGTPDLCTADRAAPATVPIAKEVAAADVERGVWQKGRFCSAPWGRGLCDTCSRGSACSSNAANNSQHELGCHWEAGECQLEPREGSKGAVEGRWALPREALLHVAARVAVAPAYTPQYPSIGTRGKVSSSCARFGAAENRGRIDIVGYPQQISASLQQQVPGTNAVVDAAEAGDAIDLAIRQLDLATSVQDAPEKAGACAPAPDSWNAENHWKELLVLAEGASKAFARDCYDCIVAEQKKQTPLPSFVGECLRQLKQEQEEQCRECKAKECCSSAFENDHGLIPRRKGSAAAKETAVSLEEMLGKEARRLVCKLAADGAATATAVRCIHTSLASHHSVARHTEDTAAAVNSNQVEVREPAEQTATAPTAPIASAAAATKRGPLGARRWAMRSTGWPYPIMSVIPILSKGIEHEQKARQQQQQQRQRLADDCKVLIVPSVGPSGGTPYEQAERQEFFDSHEKLCVGILAPKKACRSTSVSGSLTIAEGDAATPGAVGGQGGKTCQIPNGSFAAASVVAASAVADNAAATPCDKSISLATDKALVQVLRQSLTSPHQALELCWYMQQLREAAESLLERGQTEQQTQELPDKQQRNQEEYKELQQGKSVEGAVSALLEAAAIVDSRLSVGLSSLQGSLDELFRAFLLETQRAFLPRCLFSLLPPTPGELLRHLKTPECAPRDPGLHLGFPARQAPRNKRGHPTTDKAVALARRYHGGSSIGSRFAPIGAVGFPPARSMPGECELGKPRRGPSGTTPPGAWGTLSLSHVVYRSLLGPAAPKGKGVKRPRQAPGDCSSSGCCSSHSSSPQATWQQPTPEATPWLQVQQPHQETVQQQQQQLQQDQHHRQDKPRYEQSALFDAQWVLSPSSRFSVDDGTNCCSWDSPQQHGQFGAVAIPPPASGTGASNG
ncbi:hypothetical protein, conserved [Eimeria tenella]|uniref:Uncharacterized protein n=1 Tax=Eimeria tenella TaxID=5802 RepID=U6L8F2_EIMTE|nr:hypothetical protein, conserved [Eimeria tenella]CDJ45463.1 hypothetical protein, conserved [Eimeria tenella]|eukprot:XP_013236209.1 hypothetical protein, conserved [Eimeria tenella]